MNDTRSTQDEAIHFAARADQGDTIYHTLLAAHSYCVRAGAKGDSEATELVWQLGQAMDRLQAMTGWIAAAAHAAAE